MKLKAVLRRVAGAMLACLLLAGCSGAGVGAANLDELLRAPQLTGEFSAVQTALNAYLGESVQLKYPLHGDLLSPFLFGDWDGDGAQDAAVLYVPSWTTNVQLAVLQKESGVWQVRDTAEGYSDTVDSVRFAALKSKTAHQILVGYVIAGEEYLAVYSFADATLETVLQQAYTQYIVEDFTGSGTEDLVLLSLDEAGQTQVQLLTDGPGGFTSMQVVGLSSEQFSGYASLTAGEGAYGGNYLILDGWTGAAGNYLASSILHYDTISGQMEAAMLPGTRDLYADSLRYMPTLISRDIDDDGVIEIPTQPTDEAGTLNLTATKRFTFVRWMDFTARNAEKQFGIVDEEYGFYLALPLEWEGNLMMMDGETEGSILLTNLSGDVTYLELQVGEADTQPDGWVRAGTVGPKQILIKLGENVTGTNLYTLSKSIYIL